MLDTTTLPALQAAQTSRADPGTPKAKHYCRIAVQGLPPPRLPIRAELSGSRHCSALGIAVDAYTPVLTLARRLIYAGLPSDCVLEVYRGATLCFRVPLAVAARLTVEDSMNGAPRFRRYRPPSWEVGPPIAPNGRALPGEPSSKNNAPLASLTEGGTR